MMKVQNITDMEVAMIIKVMKLLVVVTALLFMALPTCGEDSGAIDVRLTVLKVEMVAGDQEVFVHAETIRPGDLLQYEIVYKVNGKDKVLELLAQLPIPEGMEYVANSARPAKVQASVDGKNFSPVPLQRRVKMVNGQELLEDIPTLDFCALGWPLRGLAPGDEVTVSARLKVNFIPEPGRAQ